MKTKESENKKELYKIPSIKVIEVSSEKIICMSPGGTEGYDVNSQSLDDGDFE